MRTDHPRPLRWRAIAAITAGLLATGAAVTAIAAAGGTPSPIQLAGVQEDQPGPCDEAEHADDPRCTGDTVATSDDDPSTTLDDDGADEGTPVADGTTKTIDAAPGGTVVVEVQGGVLVVASAIPNAGWTVDEERTEGREVEVRFTTSTARVDVQAELEDGQIRSRVRVVPLDTGTTVPGTEDRRGPNPGSDDDGSGHDLADDRGDDGASHDVGDDHGDDDRTDDRSGSGSGSGSDDSGHG